MKIFKHIIVILLLLNLIVALPLSYLYCIETDDEYNLHIKKDSYQIIIQEGSNKVTIITDQNSIAQDN